MITLDDWPMRRVMGLKGGRLLWGHLVYVRDLTFDAVEAVSLGTMTKHL